MTDSPKITAIIDEFTTEKDIYFDSYRKFLPQLEAINKRNANDGTEAVQFLVDFYAQSGRSFYLTNKNFLQTKELDSLFAKISASIASGELKDPENHSGKREFDNDLLKFCSKLNNQASLTVS